MEKIIIIRWCEIHLKGKNRGFFENLLFSNIRKALDGFSLKIIRTQARYIIEEYNEDEEELIFNKLSKVPGIHTYSPAYLVENDYEVIKKTSIELCKYKRGTFKVEAKRADKSFIYNSHEICIELGGDLLESNPNLTVDIHDPSFTFYVDVREKNKTLLYTDVIKGIGGLPVGASGKCMLLISGGIDSPVAGYMMAKRGMKVSAIHFHSYPYTSEAAKEKVVKLSKYVSNFTHGLTLYVVPFTHIQESIHEKCNPDFMITLMRRFMMRISERVAKMDRSQALVTGENLGQVASQTVESITCSNNVVEDLPIFRPLITFDKLEIIDISKKIETFETSILPYEDCCTVFLPKYPIIKPKIEKVEEMEKVLDIEGLITEAIKGIEKIEL